MEFVRKKQSAPINMFYIESMVNRLVRFNAKSIQSQLKQDLIISIRNQQQVPTHRRILGQYDQRDSVRVIFDTTPMEAIVKKKQIHKSPSPRNIITTPSKSFQHSRSFQSQQFQRRITPERQPSITKIQPNIQPRESIRKPPILRNLKLKTQSQTFKTQPSSGREHLNKQNRLITELSGWDTKDDDFN
ncbi:hypothetical protein pb186bvf_016858 [Paramecium bursaria]